MGIPEHVTCVLRNLYVGQEATVGTEHETTDYFKIGKVVQQGCILSLCLFNFFAEYIMWNARLYDTSWNQDLGRNINNFRYVDDATLVSENEEELKILLMQVKEERELETGLKLNIQKSGSITLWQIDGGKVETVADFLSWIQKSLPIVTTVMKLTDLFSLEGKLWQT